jgi:hypothetical protein
MGREGTGRDERRESSWGFEGNRLWDEWERLRGGNQGRGGKSMMWEREAWATAQLLHVCELGPYTTIDILTTITTS